MPPTPPTGIPRVDRVEIASVPPPAAPASGEGATAPGPTSASPVSASPTSASPTSASPTSKGGPTSANPTSKGGPTSANPTSANPTSANPMSAHPTSANPTSANPISNPTSADPTSAVRSAPRSRPEAPALQFTVSASDQVIICPSCRSTNPPGYRFCVTCGVGLGKRSLATPPITTEPSPGMTSEPPPPLAATPPPPTVVDDVRASAPPPASEASEKIIGAPVVDIAERRSAPPRLIRCPRCHGHSAEGMRFCKYCGAPLDEPASAARTDSEPIAVEAPPVQVPVSVSMTRHGERGERTTSPGHPPAHMPSASAMTGARPQTGRLVVIVEDGSEGKAFPLLDHQVDIGRTEGDIVLADDLYVSPRHARLIPQGGQWVLRDLHSTNGVYRRIREPHALKDADLLLLGLEVLQFETVNDAERGLGHASQHGTLLFGSPSTPRRARLCQRTVEGVVRDVYHLFRDETVIGREAGDIVFTADPFLSRRHAVVRRNALTGEFSIVDLDSSNGTYVAIRSDVTLGDGDYVRIGQHLFRVDLA
ncbi:FHA domain-containing protein [Polyangium aurulentum]|uniref:FHA domain-containing protein n=1 Tax=Polyangium aurulentum TaxID=2567896 RepID=UPI0010ADB354|nr:FHA domain-containing protein [Polyangium aurulentum]UQA59352.1 FHA domain-containing protein [Polyangium aurulentum]